MVAFLESGHAGADGLDHTRTFVATHDGEHGRLPRENLENHGVGRDVTGAQVLVRVAHATEGHLDADFAGLRVVDLNCFGAPRLHETRDD